MLSDELSLIYIGYDKDKDIWPATNSLFSLKWPSCSIRALFVSIDLPNDNSPFIPVLSPNKSKISERLNSALAAVKTPYVLVLMGDFGLFESPIEEQLHAFVDFMRTNHVDFLQLGSHLVNHLSGRRCGVKGFRAISNRRRYRLSLQPAIWSVSFLKSAVTNEIDTSWDFEVFFMDNPIGQEMSLSAKAYFPKNYSFPIINLLDKSKISFPAYRLLLKEQISLPSGRKVQTKSQYLKTRRKDFFYYHSPNWFISLIKKVFHRHGYSKS